MIDPCGGHAFKACATWISSNLHNFIN